MFTSDLFYLRTFISGTVRLNIKRLPFLFLEGQMHQNQSVYFHFYATISLKQ